MHVATSGGQNSHLTINAAPYVLQSAFLLNLLWQLLLHQLRYVATSLGFWQFLAKFSIPYIAVELMQIMFRQCWNKP